ncbi:choice-of-anchor L domain-containing protein [Enterococcus crotali]|uniref:choice-of-anchor L domain-containing protein n=1 Tax=Enterococcus crotali TaxID=1453587 RepID=UPI00046E5744|nr:choice-of-anchor L domain-containing protein [Enterococcus crotali]
MKKTKFILISLFLLCGIGMLFSSKSKINAAPKAEIKEENSKETIAPKSSENKETIIGPLQPENKAVAQNLSITTTAVISSLAEALINPEFIDYSNVKMNTRPQKTQQGTFTGGGLFGFTNEKGGIILSTGNLTELTNNGAEADRVQSNWLEGPGDADLLKLLGAGTEIQDANFIEFDFIPKKDILIFDYVFGSEEYYSYVGSEFNDVFGLFINEKGKEAQKENIALIPGTTNQHVSINNVNNGNPQTGAKAKNPQYFVPNYTLHNPTSINGYTTKLTAKKAVEVGKQYHLKLAIGDAEDGFFDSYLMMSNLQAVSYGSINVHYIDKKTQAELIPPIIFSGIEGDIFTPKSEIINGYNLAEGPVDEAGNVLTPNIEIIEGERHVYYKYSKIVTDGTVSAIHKDLEGNILDTVNQTGEINTDFTVSSKNDLYGYKLVKSPDVESGKYTEDPQEFVYIYEKIKPVTDLSFTVDDVVSNEAGRNEILHYKNKFSTTLTLPSETPASYKPIKYKTLKLSVNQLHDSLTDFKHFQVTNDQGVKLPVPDKAFDYNETAKTIAVTIPEALIETSGVLNLEYDATIKDSALVGEKIVQTASAVGEFEDGVSLSVTPLQSNEVTTTIISRESKVVVEYLEEETNKVLKEAKTIPGIVGEGYEVNTETETVKNYTFVRAQGAALQGKFIKEAQTIQLFYKRATTTLTIEFVDLAGKELFPSIVQTKNIGEFINLKNDSEIVAAIATVEEKPYKLLTEPDNVTNFEIVEGENKAKYVFEGRLTLFSAPENINFDVYKYNGSVTRVDQPLYDKDLVVQDGRLIKDRWTLRAKLTKEMQSTELDSSNVVLRNAIRYVYNGKEIILNTVEALPIMVHTNNSDQELYNISSTWSGTKTGDGLKLEVDPGDVKKVGTYQGEILWELAATPL